MYKPKSQVGLSVAGLGSDVAALPSFDLKVVSASTIAALNTNLLNPNCKPPQH